MEGDDLLDIHQAAASLRVSVTSLRRWTDSGRLRCLRVGGRRERRFRRSDLLAFLGEGPAPSPEWPRVTPEPSDASVVLVGGVPVRSGSHLVGLFATDLGRTRLSVAFLADGIRPGTTCFVVAEPAAREAILDGLAEDRATLQAAIDTGQLVLTEYADSASAQIAYWEVRFVAATRAGARSIRVVADVWGLAKAISPRALLEYEADYERLLARRFPVITMCQYDVRHFSSFQILEALRGHGDSFLLPVERLLG